MEELINQFEKKEPVGGIITCVVKNVPIGLGEPVFDKLHAQLERQCFQLMP